MRVRKRKRERKRSDNSARRVLEREFARERKR